MIKQQKHIMPNVENTSTKGEGKLRIIHKKIEFTTNEIHFAPTLK